MNTTFRLPLLRPLLVLVGMTSLVGADFLQPSDAAAQSNSVSSQSISSVPVQTFYTSQQKFQIPFSINPNGRELVEVQLYVSHDRGRKWSLHSRQNLNTGHFQFQSTADCETWFSIKSIDRDQRVYPSGPNAPDLKIIIDSQKPTLQISVQPDAAGRIVTAVHATDAHFDPQGIRIEYRNADFNNANWIDTGFNNRNQLNSGTFQDQIAWWPQKNIAHLEVRVTIKDRAGNESTEKQTVNVPQAARINQQLLSQNRLPSQPQQLGTPGDGSPFRSVSNSRIGSGADQYFQNPNPNRTIPFPSQNQEAQPGKVSWPSQTERSSQIQISQSTTGRNPPETSIPPTAAATKTTGNSPPTNGGTQGFSTVGNRNVVVSVGSTHPDLNDSGNPDTAPKASPATETKESNPSTLYRLSNLMDLARPTNQSKFLLTYDVDAIAETEIKEVGLWMTPDGGQSWRKWAIDNDKQSPFAVTVPRPGIYGFRIVVSSNEGTNSRIPRGGEAADMWVRYDNTRPRIQITSVPYGRGPNAGKLVINWKAADEQLTLRPISLAFSNRPEGPWTQIASGIRNTGNFVWKVPQHVPDRIYLQLTARDTAGNHSAHQLPNPVDVANLIPKGRIKGMMPLPGKRDEPGFQTVPESNSSRSKVTGFLKSGSKK